jgi:hypothetical protein
VFLYYTGTHHSNRRRHPIFLQMTERNLTQELLYTNYIDMENGDDVESIDYRSLIHILTELMNRIERLEKSQHTHSEMNND